VVDVIRSESTTDERALSSARAGAPVNGRTTPTPFGRAGEERRCEPSITAAFLDVAPVIPTMAVIATVFAYVGGLTVVANQSLQMPSLLGAAVALAIGGI
jgi:hypothetical protein